METVTIINSDDGTECGQHALSAITDGTQRDGLKITGAQPGGGLSVDIGYPVGLSITTAGEISKIGQDTPTDGQVLTWDNSNSKVVWETNAATAGATSLDGLSDVSYSSGDLEITSLDRIKLPDTTSTTIELKGKLLFRDFGSGDAGFDFLSIDEDEETITLDNDSVAMQFKCWSSIASISSTDTMKFYAADIHFNSHPTSSQINFDSGGISTPATDAFFLLSYLSLIHI